MLRVTDTYIHIYHHTYIIQQFEEQNNNGGGKEHMYVWGMYIHNHLLVPLYYMFLWDYIGWDGMGKRSGPEGRSVGEWLGGELFCVVADGRVRQTTG